MARIKISKQSIIFIDDGGKSHEFKRGDESHAIEDRYLDHWFIQAHKQSGNLIVLAGSPPETPAASKTGKKKGA